MNFSQCHFKTNSYRLPLLNRGIYLQIIHVRRKAAFLYIYFTARASRALTILDFKLDILQDRAPPHRKKENIVRFVTRLRSTVF